jgi:hypothetical protein
MYEKYNPLYVDLNFTRFDELLGVNIWRKFIKILIARHFIFFCSRAHDNTNTSKGKLKKKFKQHISIAYQIAQEETVVTQCQPFKLGSWMPTCRC